MDQLYSIRHHSDLNRPQTAASNSHQPNQNARRNSIHLPEIANRKLLSLSSIGLAAVCCLALSGCGSYFVENGIAGALITPATVSFGSVMVGKAVSTTIDVLNRGSAPIKLSQLTVNGQAFSANGKNSLPITLAVGETYKLSVNFNPASAGTASGQLIITSNSSSTPKAAVILTGTGVPSATAIAPALTAVSCASGTMTGAATQACSVQLNASTPAPFPVTLSSSNAAIVVPASVTVAQGATSADFSVTSSTVQSTQPATLTATAGDVSKTFAIQLQTAAAPSTAAPTLSISSTTLSFGQVVLNTTATQTVTLTSSGTAAVSISAVQLTGSGFKISGASFPATLNPGQKMNLNLEFDPAVTGTVSGQLTITSNSTSNPAATVKLTGVGIPSSHQVNLTWDAPNSSPEPVAGYHVYRSAGKNGSYQLLKNSVIAETTYADTSVQGGQNYEYVVKSVDASGVESSASNTFNVAIP
jgi:hypothetical protein